jgi:hypothetical protein
MMRQIGKQALTIGFWLLLGVLAQADALVTTVVSDPLTGAAIDGYDAVTYFTDGEPQPGKPDYEYVWQGVPWYFESAANRDVFVRNPEIYAPQFGGHCVTALSRGYVSDGKPRLYVLEALKLYLFYSSANRDAYLLSKDETLKSAAANWPKLMQQLIGPATGTISSAMVPDNAPASSDSASSSATDTNAAAMSSEPVSSAASSSP